MMMMQLGTVAESRLALGQFKRNSNQEWEKSGWFYDIENMLREIDENDWTQLLPPVQYEYIRE